MKKLFILALLVAFAATLHAGPKTTKNEVASAPYGYEKGTLVFSEKEGELAGEVHFLDGSKVSMTKVTLENDVLKCELYVEGGYVTVEAKVDGNKMSGAVNTPDGKIDLKAEKTE